MSTHETMYELQKRAWVASKKNYTAWKTVYSSENKQDVYSERSIFISTNDMNPNCLRILRVTREEIFR
jgi:hypothetical protein